MDYEARLLNWQEAFKCAEDNITIGVALKVKGMAVLNTIETDRVAGKLKEIEVKDLAALISSATQAIKEGVKLEADSREKRTNLLFDKPLRAGGA